MNVYKFKRGMNEGISKYIYINLVVCVRERKNAAFFGTIIVRGGRRWRLGTKLWYPAQFWHINAAFWLFICFGKKSNRCSRLDRDSFFGRRRGVDA